MYMMHISFGYDWICLKLLSWVGIDVESSKILLTLGQVMKINLTCASLRDAAIGIFFLPMALYIHLIKTYTLFALNYKPF